MIEAGLGGRYDATSVIEADVTVLTNVGLEHTRWLGPTIRDIAEEKLAVVRAGGTLVLGAEMAAEAREIAERVAGERGAPLLTAPGEPSVGQLRARGTFQRRNFALAQTAADAYLRPAGRGEGRSAHRAAERAAGETMIRGRLEVIAERPLTVLDGAHNPAAVRALVQALPDITAGRRLGLVLGVLEDKDAASMLEMLLAVCERAWFTAPPSSRALSPAALQSLARQLGFEAVQTEPRPARALDQARRWARAEDGAVLVTGSVYLVGELIDE